MPFFVLMLSACLASHPVRDPVYGFQIGQRIAQPPAHFNGLSYQLARTDGHDDLTGPFNGHEHFCAAAPHPGRCLTRPSCTMVHKHN